MGVSLCPAGTDLFALPAHTLVNPVNTVGVMGAGLALAFARRWPAHLAWYQEQCRLGLLQPGEPQLDRGDGSRPWILAMPTKQHWRHPSRLEWVEAGLERLAGRLPGSGIQSLALPALGCGLGGLPYAEVERAVLHYLQEAGIPVWLIAPSP